MYFWNVRQLRDSLQQSRLSEAEGFKYVLITALAISLGVELSVRFAEPVSAIENIALLANLIILPFGTYAAYAANGAASGVDFVARYLALGWVIGIRVLVLSLVAFMILTLAAVLAMPELAESDAFWDAVTAAYTVLMPSAIYWRLAVHLGHLRADPGPFGASARVSAS